MRKVVIFVFILVAAVALLLVEFAWYLYSYQAGMGSLTGTMAQMMGNQYPRVQMASMPTYVLTTLIILIVLVAVGIGGFVYYLAYPEIIVQGKSLVSSSGLDPDAQVSTPQSTAETRSEAPKENWTVLIRTSKPDERKVLEILATHDGKYLQKFIVKESGLSKLKTHRIISRFSERGIVSVEKSGNTNQVTLSPWLKNT